MVTYEVRIIFRSTVVLKTGKTAKSNAFVTKLK